MKKTLILLLFALTACTHPPEYHPVDYERLSDKVTYQVINELQKKHGLVFAGIGGGMMGNIREMSISFDLFHEVDLSEARALSIDCGQTYLQAINDSKELRPYLREYPFTIKGVRILIWIHKKHWLKVEVGSICFISLSNGTLRYRIQKPSEFDSNDILLEETYEEALKKLEIQPKEAQ